MAAIGTTNNTGWTTTSSVSEALPVIIESARIVRLFVNVVTKLVDRHTLPQGSGLVWNEIALNNLTASNITETTILENPQQLSDNLFQIVPLQVGISTLITDRTRRRISANVAGLIGQLAGRAMERKKDIDGLTIIANATTALGGSTQTMQSGYVAAGVARIQGNSTEPLLQGPYYTVLHPFQVKAIQDEVVAGIGTYNVPQGLTEETFRQGYSGNLFGTEVYTDGACSGNPGPGGWAWAVAPEGDVFASGGDAHTTNQRMELMAVLEALRSLPGELVIVSDSTYVVNCFRDRWWVKWKANGWKNSKKEPVANTDLWMPLVELVQQMQPAFRWVDDQVVARLEQAGMAGGKSRGRGEKVTRQGGRGYPCDSGNGKRFYRGISTAETRRLSVSLAGSVWAMPVAAQPSAHAATTIHRIVI